MGESKKFVCDYIRDTFVQKSCIKCRLYCSKCYRKNSCIVQKNPDIKYFCRPEILMYFSLGVFNFMFDSYATFHISHDVAWLAAVENIHKYIYTSTDTCTLLVYLDRCADWQACTGTGEYGPLRWDEGDAQQQDKEDLSIQEGGHCRPLQTHPDSWTGTTKWVRPGELNRTSSPAVINVHVISSLLFFHLLHLSDSVSY